MIDFSSLSRGHLVKIYEAHSEYGKMNAFDRVKWDYHWNVQKAIEEEFLKRYGHDYVN